jgi:hypothetical protein
MMAVWSLLGEFRGFVRSGQLTAVTQYFDACYFDNVARNHISIAANIQVG